MEQKFDDTYIIDLSYATTASDIVYELSSIIGNDRAKNQRIALKLGDVDLNQSQLLSIRSLINSINSTVECLETASVQTEQAAINLGMIVFTGKTESEQVDSVDIKEPEYVQSYGYVKLEDYLPEDCDECEGKKEDDIEEQANKTEEEVVAENDSEEVAENENSEAGDDSLISMEEINSDKVISEEQAEEIMDAKSDDVQDALDNIYTAEVKLESILESEQQEAQEEGVIPAEQVKQAVLSEEKYTEADFEIDHFATTYIKQTLRSGQIVNYDGNVVIIGDCHPGSEVVASGDISVWGILSGIAHAGAKGNERARVRALKMNAIQLRIANCYARKPDGMNTIFPERTSTFTPEEARIINNEIVIFKIND